MILTALAGINPFKILNEVLKQRPVILYTATSFATGDDETAKLWSEIVWKEHPQDFFLVNGFAGLWNPEQGKFTGTDKSGNVVQFVPYFERRKGDEITITLAMDFTSEGYAPEDIEDHEEAGEFHSFSMALEDVGNGFVLEDRLSMQRPVFNVREELSVLLRRWKDNYTENKLVSELTTSPTTNRIMDISGESGDDAKLSASVLEDLEDYARDCDPIIPPIMYQGKPWRVLLLHDRQIRDLRRDDDYREVLLNAWARTIQDNPLIKNADDVYSGLLIYRYNRVHTATGDIARGLLLGNQAGLVGYAIPWDWKEAWADRYERIPACSTAAMLAVGKVVFDEEDYATVQLKTKYTAL